MIKKTKSGRKIISRSELVRLSFCNSNKIPNPCVIEGVVKDWVGIGWIDIGRKPTKSDVYMVEDDNYARLTKKTKARR